MVGLSTVKSVHNEAPYVNAEDLGKCHLPFNSHRRGYASLEGKEMGILASFLTSEVTCHFILKLLALVHAIIYSGKQGRINPQTLFLPSSIFLYLYFTSVCRAFEAQLISLRVSRKILIFYRCYHK